MSTQSPELVPGPTPEKTTSQPIRRVGTLWRRILAFLIDTIILAFIGGLVAWPFTNTLIALGPGGRLVGYFVALLYFAVPESNIGSGASLGKRLLLLQVVHADGSMLTIEESLIRYTVFAAPYFLNALPLPMSRTPTVMSLLLGLIVYGAGGVTCYLILFNRNTRQGLHDLAAKCFVAEADKRGAITHKPIWRLHWAFAGALFLGLGLDAGAIFAVLSYSGTAAKWMDDIRVLEQLDGVQKAGFVVAWKGGLRSGIPASLTITIRCNCHEDDEEGLADEAAKALIENDQGLQQYPVIHIVVMRGYDIGIASHWTSQRFSDSPAGWNLRLFGNPSVPATE